MYKQQPMLTTLLLLAVQAFTIVAVENTCTAKVDAAAWAAVGCVVDGLT